MKLRIIRSSLHPVVKTYMDTIQMGAVRAGMEAQDAEGYEFDKDTYIVTDSALACFRYLCRGFGNHIVWIQGVHPEESYMRNKSRLRYGILSMIEKIVLKKAKLVFMVSDRMLVHYETKYRLPLRDKCVIMPCFNDSRPIEDAFAPEKYAENRFVYIGGIQIWQCFEQIAALYAEIEKRAGGNTSFSVFTEQTEEAEVILKKYAVQNYEIDYVDFQELSDRVRQMKYGFVIREDCIVNNVATPTKFSNYLAGGIIPIYSSCLEDFSAFDRELQYGIVCDIDRPEEGTERILAHMQTEISADTIREKCERAFMTYYNQEKYIGEIAVKIAALDRER